MRVSERPSKKGGKRTVFWRVYFVVLLVLTIPTYLLQGSFRPWDVVDIVAATIAFVGLFGFAWGKRILTRSFWNYFLPLFVAWNVLYLYILPLPAKVSAAGMSQSVAATLTLILVVPLFVALYRYGLGMSSGSGFGWTMRPGQLWRVGAKIIAIDTAGIGLATVLFSITYSLLPLLTRGSALGGGLLIFALLSGLGILGVGLILLAWSTWKLRTWAWTAQVAFQILTTIMLLVQLFFHIRLPLFGMGEAAVHPFMLLYLFLPAVRAVFGKT